MPDDGIGTALESAVLGVLTGFGRDRGLVPFEWRVVDYPDGHVLEGRPRESAENPVADAQQWAAALGMTEYEWDQESSRTWHLEQGHWHLEVLSSTD